MLNNASFQISLTWQGVKVIEKNAHNLKWISSLVTCSLFSPSLFLVDQNRITTIRIPVSLFPFRCGPPFGLHPFQMGGRVSLLYWGVTRSWMPVAPLTPIYNNVPNTAHRISSWARLQNVMKLLFINTEDSLVLLTPYFAYPNCHHISLETTCCFPGRQIIWLSGFKTSLTSATLSSFLISKLHSRMRVCSVFLKTAILCAVSPLLSVLRPCVVVRWSCHNNAHRPVTSFSLTSGASLSRSGDLVLGSSDLASSRVLGLSSEPLKVHLVSFSVRCSFLPQMRQPAWIKAYPEVLIVAQTPRLQM